MKDRVQSYTTAQIRGLLADAFDDVDLIALCQDVSPELCNKLGSGMRKDQIINLIIDHFRRHRDYTPLLAAVGEREPELYAGFEAFPLVEPQLRRVLQQRVKDLVDHIAQDLALLKRYEDALRYEDDPRRRARYLWEIEQLHESVARHKQEYDELEAQIVGRPPTVMQDIAAKLQQIDGDLEMRRLRQTLLERYKADEQSAVAIQVEHLDQTHLDTVQVILDALGADQIPDTLMRQTLDAVQRVLEALSERGTPLSGQQAVVDAIVAPALDVKHKFKLTLPIIPRLWAYKAKRKRGDKANLKALWGRLKWRAYGYDTRLLLALSAFIALALGGASYLVTDVCQLGALQRLITTGIFGLILSVVLWAGFHLAHVPTTKVILSVKKGLAIAGTLFLVWGIGWTIWIMVKPPVQVSPCLELDLVTGIGQKKCPNDHQDELVLSPRDLGGLQNLSGRAILTHAGGCACEWEGKTGDGSSMDRLHGPTQDCSFSFGLSDRPTSAYYLTLAVGGQQRLFIIRVQED